MRPLVHPALVRLARSGHRPDRPRSGPRGRPRRPRAGRHRRAPLHRRGSATSAPCATPPRKRAATRRRPTAWSTSCAPRASSSTRTGPPRRSRGHANTRSGQSRPADRVRRRRSSRPPRSRHRVHVEVRGAGRVGATLARLLCSAGVGRVTVDDPVRARATDVSPGRARDTGRGTSARASARGVNVRVTTTPGHAPAIVVLAPTRGTGRDEAAVLVRAGVTHLLVRVVETTAIVGPLVVPGRTSCLRCHDLHRTDRDPAWPRSWPRSSAIRPDRRPVTSRSRRWPAGWPLSRHWHTSTASYPPRPTERSRSACPTGYRVGAAGGRIRRAAAPGRE